MPHLDQLFEKLAVRLKRSADIVISPVAIGLLKAMRRGDPDRSADRFAGLLRRLGPYLAEHRVGRANLAAAYPDKPAAEIEALLLGVWDNLGRVIGEFAHLDRLWDYDPSKQRKGRIVNSDDDLNRIYQLRDSGKPALIFAAHLANWELPALAAAALGLDAAVMYRAPNVGGIADAVRELRKGHMGPLIATGPDAVFRAVAAIESGRSVAMLVDQYFTRGVEVEFFGRRCMANPTIARLARIVECPIRGTRVVRLPGRQFRVELTAPIAQPRAPDGRIDIQGTMQVITSMIEGWIREHPEQWLWLHRRWR